MKIKLAILLGILTWVFTLVLTMIFTPILTYFIPHFDASIPIINIIVIGFFGILYIRNIDQHEVAEGFFVGIVFIVVDFILDMTVFILPQRSNIIVQNYSLHVFSMIVLTLLITTFLGYLAQMTIDLK